jgi:hypothetical protein
MAKSVEIEDIGFACYNILMAHSNSNPVRRALFNFEIEGFVGSFSFNMWFEYGKLISGNIL